MTFLRFAFAAALFFGVTEGRLFQVPLGRSRSRSLQVTGDSDVDLDALYQARGVQYADLKVGCPAQSQSAIISTASSAIGFPCSGCTNDCGEGSHLNGLYHEKLSSCFSEVKCGDCLLSSRSCQAYQCPVSMSYMEGSSWSGIEVEDMVSVGGEDVGEEAFPLRFGCQNDITGLFEDQIPDGIFGMNKERGSAIAQWSELGYLESAAFSLCYIVREDVKERSGVMMLGGSDTRLHDEPMVFAKDVGHKDYEVRIKEISLRRGPGLSAGIGSTTPVGLGLSGTQTSHTAILDSGTTCTYLNRQWQDSIKEAWAQATGRKYPIFTHLSITDAELEELPTLLFELEGTTENETITIEYPPIRYMEKSETGGWDFCLSARDSARTVELGNTFMAEHDVLHDLDNQRIGFAKSRCMPSLIGISVTADADQATLHQRDTTPPRKTSAPIGVTSDADGETLPPGLKAMVLQPEPIQKRKGVDPTTPALDVLYAVLALGVVVFGVYMYCSYRRHGAPYWTEPNTKHAYKLSWISLALTVFAIIAGASLFSSTGSSLFLVLALENCVDFLSSAVVLWRFFAPSEVTEKLEAKLHEREQRASVAISMILVLLGVGIWITAIEDLLRGQEDPGGQGAAIAVSCLSVFFFGILTVFKFRYAKALESPSLYKDGVCSLIGTTLSASLFVDTLIITGTPSAWWIDPAVALCCGLASFVYGLRALYIASQDDPIFSLGWWTEDREDDNGEEASETETADYFT